MKACWSFRREPLQGDPVPTGRLTLRPEAVLLNRCLIFMKKLSHAVVALAVTGLVLAHLTGCSSKPSVPPVTRGAALGAVTTNAAPQAPAEVAKLDPPASTNVVDKAEEPLQRVPVQKPKLSPGAEEIATLAQSKVANSVLLEYVNRSNEVYDLSVAEIIYLKDLGISEEVVSAMIRRGSAQVQARTLAPEAVSTNATEAPQSVWQPQSQAAPEQPSAAPAESGQPAAAPSVPTYGTPPAAASSVQYVVSEPPTQVTYNYFYESLSPYGSWVELPSYGWCWQPTCAVVDMSWRPYCHGGRWVYSNCGWYWASDYSWGWAPFHYGRWYHHGTCGWVWTPGYTWSPAWVSWGWSGSYCGWAPLPPAAGWEVGIGLTYHGSVAGVYCGFGLSAFHWNYVSCHDMHHPNPHHYAVPRHEVNKVYSHATVINNIAIQNNTVVNHGIAPEKITAVSRREIPKVQLQDIRPTQVSSTRPDQLDRSGTKLAVYRPSLPADLRAEPGKSAPVPTTTVRRQQEISRSAPVPSASSGVPRQSLAPSRSDTYPSQVTTHGGAPRQVSERPLSSPSRIATESAPQRLNSVPQTTKSGSVQSPTQTPARSSVPQAVQSPQSVTKSSPPQPRGSQAPTPASSTPIRRETPVPVTRSAPDANPSRGTVQSMPPQNYQTERQTPTTPTRVETRKIETAGPAYSAPKLATQPPSGVTPGYVPPAGAPSRPQPMAPSSAAPSRPAYTAPAAPVRNYSAPPPASMAPAQRSYQAPPPSAPSAPARAPQSAPSGGRGGGRPQER